MAHTRHIAALGIAAGLLLSGPATAVAGGKACGDMTPNGITKLRAANVSCTKAAAIAREFSYRMPPPQGNRSRVNGWRCAARSVSRRHERVTCKRSGRRITFRSTKQIEFPAASAPPCANCAGRI